MTLQFTGSCALPSALQGVDPMPIISDSECTTRWGSSFNSQLMICVYNGSQGSCNVSNSRQRMTFNLISVQTTFHIPLHLPIHTLIICCCIIGWLWWPTVCWIYHLWSHFLGCVWMRHQLPICICQGWSCLLLDLLYHQQWSPRMLNFRIIKWHSVLMQYAVIKVIKMSVCCIFVIENINGCLANEQNNHQTIMRCGNIDIIFL